MEYPVDSQMLKYNVVQTAHMTEVAMYFLPHPSAEFTIIFSHGNATDIGQMRDFLLDLRKRLKVNIVAYDYSGYGLSSGEFHHSISGSNFESSPFDPCFVLFCCKVLHQWQTR